MSCYQMITINLNDYDDGKTCGDTQEKPSLQAVTHHNSRVHRGKTKVFKRSTLNIGQEQRLGI